MLTSTRECRLAKVMEPIDMDDKSNPPEPVNVDTTGSESAGMSRRSLLSGASKAAVPVIITLYSGGTLATGAISSNLISAKTGQGASGGKFQCLDTSSVYAHPTKANTYDLGNPAMGRVTRINSPTKTYYKPGSSGPSSTTVTGTKMCTDGGDFYRKDSFNSYTKVNVKKGVLVSATALSSFSNKITYTDV